MRGGASAEAISEWVLAAMLAFEKRLPETWLDGPPERWAFAGLGTLSGRTLGLVGLGGIGAAVARRAEPFGMHIVACRHTDAPSPLPYVEVLTGLDDVLAVADHLVIAAASTGETRHLLDARAFARVQPGLHLVNIARGALVDQDALRVALDDGRVSLASLDVVDPEPLPAGHWLYEHPRVHVSAHISWNNPDGLEPQVESIAANVRRYVAGEPLVGVVDRGAGY